MPHLIDDGGVTTLQSCSCLPVGTEVPNKEVQQLIEGRILLVVVHYLSGFTSGVQLLKVVENFCQGKCDHFQKIFCMVEEFCLQVQFFEVDQLGKGKENVVTPNLVYSLEEMEVEVPLTRYWDGKFVFFWPFDFHVEDP